MNAKKIMIIISIALLATTLVLSIITLVNYYNYVGVLNNLLDPETTELAKFDLQESRDSYQYKTLTMIIWVCYFAIASAITSIVTFVLHKTKKAPRKIR